WAGRRWPWAGTAAHPAGKQREGQRVTSGMSSSGIAPSVNGLPPACAAGKDANTCEACTCTRRSDTWLPAWDLHLPSHVWCLLHSKTQVQLRLTPRTASSHVAVVGHAHKDRIRYGTDWIDWASRRSLHS